MLSNIIFSTSLFGAAGIKSFALLYADPGTGTFILQLLAAALFGLMFYIRIIIRKIKGMGSGKKVGKVADGVKSDPPDVNLEPAEVSSAQRRNIE